MDEGRKIRCSTCRTEFEFAKLEPMYECPTCGSNAPPQELTNDVTITLNWADLRQLVNLVESYLNKTQEDLQRETGLERLFDLLRKARPAGAPPLTVLDELEELRESGFDVTMHEDDFS